jgi:hypothetical protein
MRPRPVKLWLTLPPPNKVTPLRGFWPLSLHSLVNVRGLTTSPIYYEGRALEIVFDFYRHRLDILTSKGWESHLTLEPMPVADFFERVMVELGRAGVQVEVDEHPSEIPDAIPFSRDRVHAAYDRDFARRFWQALLQADRVLKQFRTGFIGKCSPVHFFWGSFDLAVTRFSGRRAPPHPGGVPGLADEVVREAYSHEVSSAGFWPGSGAIDYPAFIPMLIRSRKGSKRPRSSLRPHFIVRSCASSCCLTTRFEMLQTRTQSCSPSCNRLTKPPPTAAGGNGLLWNADLEFLAFRQVHNTILLTVRSARCIEQWLLSVDHRLQPVA